MLKLSQPKTARRRLRHPRAAATVRRPPRTVYTQMPVEPYSSWTVARVRDTLSEHEDGSFGNSAILIDWMGRDERIAGDLETRTSALIGKSGVGFELTPAEVPNADRAAIVCASVTDWWFRALPEATQQEILESLVMGGLRADRLGGQGRPVGAAADPVEPG